MMVFMNGLVIWKKVYMNIRSKLIKIISYSLFLLTFFKKNTFNKSVYIEMTKVASSRRLIVLVRYFYENGYFCLVHIPVKKFIRVFLSELYVFREVNVRFSLPRFAGTADLLLTDRPDYFSNKEKMIVLDYNVFEKKKDYSDGYFFPISFYPSFLTKKNEQFALSGSKNTKRKILVLFVGTIDHHYKNERTKDYFKINTRSEVFDYIVENIPSDMIYIPKSWEEMKKKMVGGELEEKIVLLNAKKVSIPQDEYFPVLHDTWFFIHMSGYIQPFCHNQIEAMACGVIPITQFPQLFKPQLEPGTQALVYATLPDLKNVLMRILHHEIDGLDQMREYNIDYYKNYYSYDAFKHHINFSKKMYICAGRDSLM